MLKGFWGIISPASAAADRLPRSSKEKYLRALQRPSMNSVSDTNSHFTGSSKNRMPDTPEGILSAIQEVLSQHGNNTNTTYDSTKKENDLRNLFQ